MLLSSKPKTTMVHSKQTWLNADRRQYCQMFQWLNMTAWYQAPTLHSDCGMSEGTQIQLQLPDASASKPSTEHAIMDLRLLSPLCLSIVHGRCSSLQLSARFKIGFYQQQALDSWADIRIVRPEKI